MTKIEIFVDGVPTIERELKYTNKNQLLQSFIAMIDFAEHHKGSAMKMSRDLSKKGVK